MQSSSFAYANRLVVFLLILFLLAPVFIVFPLSISADSYIAWPPSAWSLKWFLALPQQRTLVAAMLNSLILASVVSILAVVVGLMVAYVLGRSQFLGRDALTSFFSLPLLLPTIVLGLGVLILFAQRGWTGTWTGLTIAHLTITLPYTIRVLMTSLSTLPADIEAAAASLGASPLAVVWHITLPLISNGLIAAGVLSFLISFDEVVISLFVVGPRLSTLPVELFRMVEERGDPMPAAISVVMVVVTLVLALAVERMVGLRRAIGTGG